MCPDERAAIIEERLGVLHAKYPYSGDLLALGARAFSACQEVLYAEDAYFARRSAINALLLEAADHFEEVAGQDLDYAKECMAEEVLEREPKGSLFCMFMCVGMNIA